MKKSRLFPTLFLAVTSLLIAGIGLAGTPQIADCTDCGSGALGAYTASTNTSIAGGLYEFTTFTIDPGVVVTVTGPDPLVIMATDAVVINGSLVASGGAGGDGVTFTAAGAGGIGVAGGSDGGAGSFDASAGPLDGEPGAGTGAGGEGSGWSGGGGAGYATSGGSSGGVGGVGGITYGDANITALLGGSSGGGGSGGNNCGSGGGGAGGGAIQITSCLSVTIGPAGSLEIEGGDGGSDGSGNCGGGGAGSGGSLILTTPTLTVDGTISGLGGTGGASQVPGDPYYGVGGDGGDGRIHFDTETGNVGGVGSITPIPDVAICSVPVELMRFVIE